MQGDLQGDLKGDMMENPEIGLQGGVNGGSSIPTTTLMSLQVSADSLRYGLSTTTWGNNKEEITSPLMKKGGK